jgi:transposase-like protein
MKARKYSDEFKQQAVLKFINRGTKTVGDLEKELNTSYKNIYRWHKEFSGATELKKTKKIKNEITPEEKLQIINETSSLKENELGEYLRKHGLHFSQIQEWKSEFLTSVKNVGRPKKDPEVLELRKSEKDLKRELRRKEKALAEMSARVVLLKKSHEIFGGTEDDE